MKRLLKNYLLLFYLGFWGLIIVAHFLILNISFKMDAATSLNESLVFNIIYAIVGVGLWFMVKFSDLNKKRARELFFLHLSSVTGMLTIWLVLSYSLLKGMFSDDIVYKTFLDDSFSVRIIVGVFYYIVVVAMAYLIINFKELKNQRKKEDELNQLLRDAELNLLRSQIKPHFLFNSLNSISSLTMTNPENAQEMVIKLSEFIRYSLDAGGKTMTTMGLELKHVLQYVEIEKVRYGKRLNINHKVPEELESFPIPAMMLQPLVENAVKHGVFDSLEGSTISLKAEKEGKMLVINVGNTIDSDIPPVKGTGTGLKNIRLRLNNIFGRTDLIRIEKKKDYFNVELKIPDYEG